jgi:Ca2+-binding RTX toxin-like protein
MKTATRTRLTLEAMEERYALDAYISTAGNLVVYCGDGNDYVTVRQVLHAGVSKFEVSETGIITRFRTSDVTGRISFYGNGGSDTFYNNTGRTSMAKGGSGRDELYGGSASDVLYGGSGNDILVGRKGKDYLYGGSNDDFLAGNSHSYSDGAQDYMEGGTGRDVFAYGLYWSGSAWKNEDLAGDFNSAEDVWRNDTP